MRLLRRNQHRPLRHRPRRLPRLAFMAPPEPSTAQRLQELETLRATGAISEDEYNTKRQQILSDL